MEINIKDTLYSYFEEYAKGNIGIAEFSVKVRKLSRVYNEQESKQ